MRVLVDALALASGRAEGAATYVRELTEALNQVLTSDDEVLVLARRGVDVRIGSRVRVKRAPVGQLARVRRRVTGVRRPVSVKHVATRFAPDVVHFAVGWADVEDLEVQVPMVFTPLDVLHYLAPESLPAGDLDARLALLPLAYRRADRILALSEFAAAELRTQLGLGSDRVKVVHWAGSLAPPSRARRFPAPYAYYPAGDWPHKNHGRLLEAWRHVVDAGIDGHLVLTGIVSDGWREVADRSAALGLSDRVHHLGSVGGGELSATYRDARVVVNPSEHEAFGVPLLEAMAAGVPVACSAAGSFPEVAGDAAVYFDPRDPHAIAAAIATVWRDETLRAELVARGADRVRAFSWEKTARETVAQYREVAGGT